MLSITLVIIIITCITSFMAFSNENLQDKLIFYPPAISENKEYYRFFSCGLIHANTLHLIFNMWSFYMFGGAVEQLFRYEFGPYSKWLFLFMYISSLFVCLIPTYLRNRHNSNYLSLGASGAVSAVIFSFIFMNPLAELSIIFVPGIHLPGFVFGLLYLVISSVMDKKGGGNINHSAHIWGALYGISFLIIAGNLIGKELLLQKFAEQVSYYFRTF